MTQTRKKWSWEILGDTSLCGRNGGEEERKIVECIELPSFLYEIREALAETSAFPNSQNLGPILLEI